MLIQVILNLFNRIFFFQMDTLRKQQDSVSNTENSVYQVRSYLEGK